MWNPALSRSAMAHHAPRVLVQLEAVTAERDGLYEDLINHRTSKRTVDKQWRIEREKSERLETELAFYQSQTARTLSDRDKVLPHSDVAPFPWKAFCFGHVQQCPPSKWLVSRSLDAFNNGDCLAINYCDSHQTGLEVQQG